MDAMFSSHGRLIRPARGSSGLRLSWLTRLVEHSRHVGTSRTEPSTCSRIPNGAAVPIFTFSKAVSVQTSASDQQHRFYINASKGSEVQGKTNRHEQQRPAWKSSSSTVQRGVQSRAAQPPARRSRPHLHGLNDEQRAAVMARVDGCVRVVAGPGSGKTRVLTHRVAHLVIEHKVPARKILVSKRGRGIFARVGDMNGRIHYRVTAHRNCANVHCLLVSACI